MGEKIVVDGDEERNRSDKRKRSGHHTPHDQGPSAFRWTTARDSG